MNLVKLLPIITLIVPGLGVIAQEHPESEASAPTPVPSFPCEEDERFAEFDFWVGEWDVHDASGTYQGSNAISREQHACVLIENWTGAGGSTGMSINYFDAKNSEWVQYWIAAGGYHIDIRGGLTEDGMLLTGMLHVIKKGTTQPFRGLWTALADGRVRQYFEISNDDGETWTPWFEGFYSRQSAD